MSLKNLVGREALDKLKELAEDARTCMFCTELDKQPFSCRPMSLQEVDEEGNLWFISSADSNKNFEISRDNRTQLIFMNNSSAEYLSIYGNSQIFKDRRIIEEQWTPMVNAWFEGKDDPNVTVIRVNPTDVYYWDSKTSKIVTLAKMATAAVTGKRTGDDGVEGTLQV